MTRKSRLHFLASILPYIQQLAVRRAAGIDDPHCHRSGESAPLRVGSKCSTSF